MPSQSGTSSKRRVAQELEEQVRSAFPAVEVDGDDVGAKGHEDLEGAHGRAGAEHHKVLVGKVEPLGVGDALEDGIAGGRLDGAVGDPLVDLGDKCVSGEGLFL